MKAIKMAFVVSFMLVSTAVFAQSQGRNSNHVHQGPPPVPSSEQIERMVNHLAEEISLSKVQKEEILELHVEHFKTVKEKTADNARPERKEMEKLRKEFEGSIKDLLTEEQIIKYDAFLKEMRAKHPGRKS